MDEIIAGECDNEEDDRLGDDGENIGFIFSDSGVGFYHEISEEGTKEKVKNKECQVESIVKIKFKNFIYKKSKMTGNVCS